jgi:FkbM family methyltransferase
MSAALNSLSERNGAYARLRTYLRTYPEWRFAPPRVQLRRRLEKFGSDYGGYFVDTSALSRRSIVYSLGIGEDISFDLSLIEQFGAEIQAFDPTPKVATWLSRQALPREFHFHPMGIAGHDGEETFYVPPRKDWISHSIEAAKEFGRESVRFPVERLATAMKRLGHSRIDLLKMDIEGAEYAVIEDIVRERIPVTQVLVEFHHRLSSVGIERTRNTLAALERMGMRIAYVCPRAEIFTLIGVF